MQTGSFCFFLLIDFMIACLACLQELFVRGPFFCALFSPQPPSQDDKRHTHYTIKSRRLFKLPRQLASYLYTLLNIFLLSPLFPSIFGIFYTLFGSKLQGLAPPWLAKSSLASMYSNSPSMSATILIREARRSSRNFEAMFQKER